MDRRVRHRRARRVRGDPGRLPAHRRRLPRPEPHDRETDLAKIITAIGAAVPTTLTELITLGRTLKRRAADVLAYFVRPGTSNESTEAINGRLEHLCGSALGFRNLTNHIARSLLETGGFRPRPHPRSG